MAAPIRTFLQIWMNLHIWNSNEEREQPCRVLAPSRVVPSDVVLSLADDITRTTGASLSTVHPSSYHLSSVHLVTYSDIRLPLPYQYNHVLCSVSLFFCLTCILIWTLLSLLASNGNVTNTLMVPIPPTLFLDLKMPKHTNWKWSYIL